MEAASAVRRCKVTVAATLVWLCGAECDSFRTTGSYLTSPAVESPAGPSGRPDPQPSRSPTPVVGADARLATLTKHPTDRPSSLPARADPPTQDSDPRLRQPVVESSAGVTPAPASMTALTARPNDDLNMRVAANGPAELAGDSAPAPLPAPLPTASAPEFRGRAPDPLARSTPAPPADKEPVGANATQALLERLRHESDPAAWQLALATLETHGAEAVAPALWTGVAHRSAEVRRLACQLLARIKPPGAVSELVALLEGNDPRVSEAAAAALGELGDPSALEPLETALGSRAPGFRLTVSRSLAKLGSVAGREELARLARNDDPQIRRSAIVAIGELGDRRFVPGLIDALGDDSQPAARAALAGLSAITRLDFSEDAQGRSLGPEQEAVRWRRWWQRERAAMPPGPPPKGLTK